MQGVPESRCKQLGFSLLEVMVSGVIMSFGLAGVAALLLTAVVGTSDVADRSSATILAGSLASLVDISQSQTGVFLGAAPESALKCNDASPCNAFEFARSNYSTWQQEVARQLPGGVGIACHDATPEDGTSAQPGCDGTGLLHIKIFWQKRPGSGGLDSRVVKALSL